MQAFRRHYRIMNIIYPGSTFVLVETKKIIIFNIRVIKIVSLTGIPQSEILTDDFEC